MRHEALFDISPVRDPRDMVWSAPRAGYGSSMRPDLVPRKMRFGYAACEYSLTNPLRISCDGPVQR